MKKEVKIRSDIYPFINNLVDSLFTDDINKLIQSENVRMDRATYMMFITMYFATRLYSIDTEVTKDDIKSFMSELIRNPDKRRKCIELFHPINGNLLDEKVSKNLLK